MREARLGAQYVDRGGVTTGADGRFQFPVPAGSSRVLRLAYRAYKGDDAFVTRSTSTLNTRARISVRGPKRVRSRGVAKFSGRLVGRPFPPRGVTLDLQIFQPGVGWRVFANDADPQERHLHRPLPLPAGEPRALHLPHPPASQRRLSVLARRQPTDARARGLTPEAGAATPLAARARRRDNRRGGISRLVSTAPATQLAQTSDLLERSRQLDGARGDARRRAQHARAGASCSSRARRAPARPRSRGASPTSTARSARILWGACDALFTPRALGPLLDVAEETGGDLARGHGGRRGAARGRGRAAARARAPRADDPRRSRTCTGPTRRPSTSCGCWRARRTRRRRWSSPPTATTSSTCATRCGSCSASWPRRRSIARCELPRLSPEAVAQLAEPHGIDADELYRRTAGNPFFLSEVLAGGDRDIPPTVRDAVLARTARLSATAAALLGAVSVSQPQAELWLLEALAGRGRARLPRRVPRLGHADADGRRRRLPPRAGADDDRGDARAPPPGGAAPRRAGGARSPRRPARRTPRGSPTTPRPPATPPPCSSSRPAAAARAESVGAHRQAAAQYARALRFAADLPLAEARRPPRGPLPLRLPRRRLRRGDRGDAGGARRPPHAGRSAARGRQDAPALGRPLLPRRPLRGGRAARPATP